MNRVDATWRAYQLEKKVDKPVAVFISKADARIVVQRIVQELNVLDRNLATFTAIKRRAKMNRKVSAKTIDPVLKLFEKYVADVRATYKKWKKLMTAPEKTRTVSIFPIGFKSGPRFVKSVNSIMQKLHENVETAPLNARNVPILRTKNNVVNTKGKTIAESAHIESTKNKLIKTRQFADSLVRDLNRAKYELAASVNEKTRATKKWKDAQASVERAIRDTKRFQADQKLLEDMLVSEVEHLQQQLETAKRNKFQLPKYPHLFNTELGDRFVTA
jgi:hypothetical protein